MSVTKIDLLPAITPVPDTSIVGMNIH